jgi:hypothetical protein
MFPDPGFELLDSGLMILYNVLPMINDRVAFLVQFAAILAMGSVLGGEVNRGQDRGDTDKVPIYDSDSSHLWNRLHRAFFIRPKSRSDEGTADAVDPPLWVDTSEFLMSGNSYREAIDVLDEFLMGDLGTPVDAPTKRAVLQHDLWSVFDWSARTKPDQSGSGERNLMKLRSRLAEAIQKLALSEKELASLSDNLSDAVNAGSFDSIYDESDPRNPFLPRDLLEPNGPWVCVRGVLAGPSAPVHVEYYQGRSPFQVFISLPGGRKETLNYIRNLNQATRQSESEESELPQFPVGTMVALLRRMAVIDASGEIRVTPLTQTLQIRVYRQVGSKVTDHENSQAAIKFRLSRSRLFAKENGGLEPIDWNEPLGISLLQRRDTYEHEPVQSSIKTTMQSCIACHSCGGATIHSIFTYKQDDWVPAARLMAANRLRLTVTDPVTESKRTVSWKTGRYEWGLLKGLQGDSLIAAGTSD